MSNKIQRKKARRKGFQRFTKLFAGNTSEAAALRLEFEDPASPDQTSSLFAPTVLRFTRKAYPTSPPAHRIISDYLSWFNKLPARERPAAISESIANRQRAASSRAWQRYNIVKDVLLNPDDPLTIRRAREIYSSISTYVATSYIKENEYPKRHRWIYDSKSAGRKWRQHITKGDLPDKRNKRKPMHFVKEKELRFDVKPEESAKFVDGDGNLVMLVIRNFCLSEELLKWADDVANRNVGDRKSIRLEDAGSIVMAGWSAGARSAPQFHWVRNLLKKTAETEAHKLAREGASAFALMWNMCRGILPAVVIEDIERFIETSGIHRMDVGEDGSGPTGQYTVPIDGGWATFRNAAMAPPCGVFARNYARQVESTACVH
ncbi:hypothetical protein VNI00_018076 [Paramarasmius palmivorus]|uniref:Uncharacterized protein n=1 Tax=Paramarasmius palmivorus TaxID=297713 RepID=A0AAW0B2G7_9AGAR